MPASEHSAGAPPAAALAAEAREVLRVLRTAREAPGGRRPLSVDQIDGLVIRIAALQRALQAAPREDQDAESLVAARADVQAALKVTLALLDDLAG